MNIYCVVNQTGHLSEPTRKVRLDTPLAYSNTRAHSMRFTVLAEGSDAPATLTGVGVTAQFLRKGNNTTVTPINGTVSGNVCEVVLPASCYNVPGRFVFTMDIGVSGTNPESRTVLWVEGMVERNISGEIIDPGTPVPNITQAINNANAAASAASSAATAANYAAATAVNAIKYVAPTETTTTASQAYAVGDYLVYNGNLYRVKSPIASGGTIDTTGNDANVIKINDGLGEEVSSIRGAVGSEDTFVNNTLGYVNYDYDTPYEQTPRSGSWKTVFGIKRSLQTIIINRENASATTVRMRISGDVDLAGNNAGAQAWTDGVQLIDGHKYAARIKMLSGTSTNSGTAEVPPVHVLNVGTTTTIATADATEPGRYNFTATSTKVNIVIPIATGYVFTNAKFLVTLEDLTASRLSAIESDLSEAEGDISTLSDKIDDIQEHDFDLTVLGSATLENSTNIDDLTPGTYKVVDLDSAATMTGTPPTTSAPYKIVVMRLSKASKTMQVAMIGSPTNPKIKIRFNTNSAWTDWGNLTTSADLVNLATSADLEETNKRLQSLILSLYAAETDLSSGTISPAGAAGDNSAFMRTPSTSFPVAKRGDIIAVDGDYEIVRVLIYNSRSMSSTAKYDKIGPTADTKHCLIIPDAYIGKYVGVVIQKTSMIGEDISSYVSDAKTHFRYYQPTITPEAIDSLDDRVTALETVNTVPDYYFEDNYIQGKVTSILNNRINSSYETPPGEIDPMLEFLWFTDPHFYRSTVTNVQNGMQDVSIAKYIAQNTGITNVVCGGDLVDDNSMTRAQGLTVLKEVRKFLDPIWDHTHLVIGNHDWNDPSGTHFNPDKPAHPEQQLYAQTIYNLFLKDKEKEYGAVNITNCSYWIDDSFNQVRTIYLACDFASTFLAADLTWFRDQLLTIPSGWNLLVLSHVGLNVASQANVTWEGNFKYVAAMLDLLKQKGNGTINTVVCDFSQTNVTVVGVISGHNHRDLYKYTTNGIPVITSTCDRGPNASSTQPFNSARAYGTITEQAIDAVQINLKTRKIYMTRIGGSYDGDGSLATPDREFSY